MEKKKNMNTALAIIVCLVVAGVLVYISINNKANNTESNVAVNNNKNNPMVNIPPADTSINKDTTQIAKAGDTVSMNYTGWLENGTAFDSNVDPKFNHVEPFVFTLGAGQVIAGWDKGIVGMKVGERKTLKIPPADAYGANGIPGTIPPNSTLIFNVELLSIKK